MVKPSRTDVEIAGKILLQIDRNRRKVQSEFARLCEQVTSKIPAAAVPANGGCPLKGDSGGSKSGLYPANVKDDLRQRDRIDRHGSAKPGDMTGLFRSAPWDQAR